MEHDDKATASSAPIPSGGAAARAPSLSRDADATATHEVLQPTPANDTGGAERSSTEHRVDAPTSRNGSESPSDLQESRKEAPKKPRAPKSKKGAGSHPNNVRKLRLDNLMSQAELARRANLSVGTIDRVEKGFGCRMETKRKILKALGLSLGDRADVFPAEEK